MESENFLNLFDIWKILICVSLSGKAKFIQFSVIFQNIYTPVVFSIFYSLESKV